MTERQTTRFSDNNTPIYGLMEHIHHDDDAPAPPRPIQRQSNEWLCFFGNYPSGCAEISDNSSIYDIIGKGRTHTRRHIYSGLVKNSNDLALFPTRKEVYEAQKYVCEKIELVIRQLVVFAEAGIFKYTSKASEIIILMEEPVYINFVVADDTGMFHVLISKSSRFSRATLLHPNMEELNKLIYVLRNIFDRNESPLFSNFDFDLDEDRWHALQHLTIESTQEYLPIKSALSLIHPDLLEPCEDGLEWC